MYAMIILLSSIISVIIVATAEGAGGMVSITRSIKSTVDGLFGGNYCNFSRKIVLGGFHSLESDDIFLTMGNNQLAGFNTMIYHINCYECGVQLNGLGNYSFELHTYDSQSSVNWSSAI